MKAETGHDIFLSWLSERGSGSWEQFRNAYDWLFPAGSREPWQTAGFGARIYSTLGHIEMDWDADRWSVGPSALTLLPSAGAHALLTGSRTNTLVEKVNVVAEEEEVDLSPLPMIPQSSAPSAWLVAVEDERAARRLADELGIPFTFSVSEDLSRALPRLDATILAAEKQPPRRGYGIERFDTGDLRWVDANDDGVPGFYRYDTPGRPELRLYDSNGRAYAPDLASGVWAALSRWGENRIKYDRQQVNGELVVPLATPLPTLQARAAALCTGLEPAKRGVVLVYRNVPEVIAWRIAESLDQSLIEIGRLAQQ